MSYHLFQLAIIAAAVVVFAPAVSCPAEERPDVILILTDDQGYGGLTVDRNPVLKTPTMDLLSKQSAAFVCLQSGATSEISPLTNDS